MKENYRITRVSLPPGIKLEENVYITMRDGVQLAVDVYRPDAEGRYPVILGLSPYRKEAQAGSPLQGYHSEVGNISFYVPRGYVMVFATARGAGMSQGQYNFVDKIEQRDGYDLVEGIAQQPWCNGNVGMLGGSYFGISQYYTAAQRPPHLKCIVPCDAGTDLYRDFLYPGGCFFGPRFVSNWAVNLINDCLHPGHIEGKHSPMNLFSEWLTNYLDGPWYWERSAIYFIDKIEVPVLSIASASSFLHSGGHLRGYCKIKSTKKLVVAPKNPPTRAMFSSIYWNNQRINEYILRWLDYWLKGIDTGIMDEPSVVIYDSGTKEWRYEHEYPLVRTKWTKFYLHSNPTQTEQLPPRLLTVEEPAANAEPVTYNAILWGGGHLRHRAELTLNKQVLTYTTPPLTQDLRLYGPLSATLYASSVTEDTTPLAWFVNVGDFAPDGPVTMITAGNLKASHREVDEAKSSLGQPWHPFNNPVVVEPNKIYEYQIKLQPIFHTFKVGHKVWLQIANDDPGVLVANFSDRVMGPIPAENSIYHDKAHPSHLVLPVIPDAPIIAPVKEPLL